MRSFLFAMIGTLFTFAMTALGAALVFFFRSRISARVGRLCFGFAGGVMSAAAVFSLLLPAMEQAAQMGGEPWQVVLPGFCAGILLMIALDVLMAHLQAQDADPFARRRAMLIGAVTLHNIPEGMAVGLAFAAAAGMGSAAQVSAAQVSAAWAPAAAMALGIGIQNIPEGAAIALPLRQGGMSRAKSFCFGAASGAVEPVFGMLAALCASAVSGMMPLLMAISSGAMMWVVFSEMLPESGQQRDGAICAAVGYVLMMALDLVLG